MTSTILEVATITIFPLIFFFSQLYYTDVASLVSVLACYQASLSEKRWMSSAGVTAVSLTFEIIRMASSCVVC